MKVSEIMERKMVSMRADETVLRAAQKMRDADVGVIPIFESNREVGIITDRDIVVRAIAVGLNPAHISVGEIMSKDPKSCSQDADIQDAAQVMENHGIRRLLVKDDTGKVVGILSLGDVARVAGKELSGEILEAVSKHE